MSEASRVWRVEVDGEQHEIEVDHTSLTGKIVVTLDGTVVDTDRMLARTKRLDVPLGSHTAVVTVDFAYAGMGAASKLHLDGTYVEPLSR